jgi:ubiquinone/menaquinone biosynthesis C-methylase UbiE
MTHRDSKNRTQHLWRGDDADSSVQQHVNRYFDTSAPYWDGVYRGASLQDVIYQQRQAAVLEYVDAAGLSPGAAVLEIGCGAGHLTLALVGRDLNVVAVDASPAMVDATATRVREAQPAQPVTVEVADAHALPFESERFDLVVAVGVMPWLHSPATAIAEMARVLRPEGELVLTADNRARLVSFFDPRAIVALTPLKRAKVALRRRQGLATTRLDYPRGVNRLLLQGRLEPLARRTIGFGPLSFMGRPVMSEARSINVHARLQSLADRGTPGLRWTGWHYLVRARKPRNLAIQSGHGTT